MKLYIVLAVSGSESGHSSWPVAALKDENAAKKLLVSLTNRASEVEDILSQTSNKKRKAAEKTSVFLSDFQNQNVNRYVLYDYSIREINLIDDENLDHDKLAVSILKHAFLDDGSDFEYEK